MCNLEPSDLLHVRVFLPHRLIVLVKMASDRVICFGTFLASCAAIALLCGSLASQHWVVSTAHRVRKGKQDFFTAESQHKLTHLVED